MLVAYFGIMGALFLFYGFFRALLWWEFRGYQGLPPSNPYTGPATRPIDTSALSERLEHVRKDHNAEPRVRSSESKRPLLLKKREEISRLAFFQKPPPPEDLHDEGNGLNLLLV